jgi:hypothetical protein
MLVGDGTRCIGGAAASAEVFQFPSRDQTLNTEDTEEHRVEQELERFALENELRPFTTEDTG